MNASRSVEGCGDVEISTLPGGSRALRESPCLRHGDAFTQVSGNDRGSSITDVFDHHQHPNVEISTFSTSADGTTRSLSFLAAALQPPTIRKEPTVPNLTPIPAHVVEAWKVLPDRRCPCRAKCGRNVKIVCEDGWNDLGDWLPPHVADAPLDSDLLVQVLIYWVLPDGASQVEFNREYDRLEAEVDAIFREWVTA